MKKNQGKIEWKKIEKSKRELFQKELRLLLKKVEKINEDSFPKNVQDKLNLFTSYKSKYDDSLIINNRLINSLEENKINRIKNEDIFKSKAKDFSSKAQLEIKKIKDELHQKNEIDLKEIHKYKAAEIFEDILIPIKNIKNALNFGKKQDSAELKNYLIGFEMLVTQLETKLFDLGLRLIEPKIGEKFNPKFHNALSSELNKKYKEKIIVIKEHGYILHDRVLIPANVIIGK